MKVVFTLILLLVTIPATAQVVSRILPATGAEAVTYDGIQFDRHWRVDGAPAAITPGRDWWSQWQGTSWITSTLECEPNTKRDYSLVVNIPANADLNSVVIEGEFAVTGFVEPLINGQGWMLWPVGSVDFGRSQLFGFTTAQRAHGSTLPFVHGDNVLTLRVHNDRLSENALCVTALSVGYSLTNEIKTETRTLRDVRNVRSRGGRR